MTQQKTIFKGVNTSISNDEHLLNLIKDMVPTQLENFLESTKKFPKFSKSDTRLQLFLKENPTAFNRILELIKEHPDSIPMYYFLDYKDSNRQKDFIQLVEGLPSTGTYYAHADDERVNVLKFVILFPC